MPESWCEVVLRLPSGLVALYRFPRLPKDIHELVGWLKERHVPKADSIFFHEEASSHFEKWLNKVSVEYGDVVGLWVAHKKNAFIPPPESVECPKDVSRFIRIHSYSRVRSICATLYVYIAALLMTLQPSVGINNVGATMSKSYRAVVEFTSRVPLAKLSPTPLLVAACAALHSLAHYVTKVPYILILALVATTSNLFQPISRFFSMTRMERKGEVKAKCEEKEKEGEKEHSSVGVRRGKRKRLNCIPTCWGPLFAVVVFVLSASTHLNTTVERVVVDYVATDVDLWRYRMAQQLVIEFDYDKLVTKSQVRALPSFFGFEHVEVTLSQQDVNSTAFVHLVVRSSPFLLPDENIRVVAMGIYLGGSAYKETTIEVGRVSTLEFKSDDLAAAVVRDRVSLGLAIRSIDKIKPTEFQACCMQGVGPKGLTIISPRPKSLVGLMSEEQRQQKKDGTAHNPTAEAMTRLIEGPKATPFSLLKHLWKAL